MNTSLSHEVIYFLEDMEGLSSVIFIFIIAIFLLLAVYKILNRSPQNSPVKIATRTMILLIPAFLAAPLAYLTVLAIFTVFDICANCGFGVMGYFPFILVALLILGLGFYFLFYKVLTKLLKSS